MHCSAKEIIKNRNECFVSLDSRKAESGKILFFGRGGVQFFTPTPENIASFFLRKNNILLFSITVSYGSQTHKFNVLMTKYNIVKTILIYVT